MLDARLGAAAEIAFITAIASGQFPVLDFTTADWQRCRELLETYEELRLGVVDASVIAVAERLRLTEIATLNHRDFRVVRPRHRDAFELLPSRYFTPMYGLTPTSVDPTELRAELGRSKAENARLRRLLHLRPGEDEPPGPSQTGIFDAPPGTVDNDSPAETKMAFYGHVFAARTDVYAVRWENNRTGGSGWAPAVRGGWHKAVDRHDYLPLTDDVIRRHLTDELVVAAVSS